MIFSTRSGKLQGGGRRAVVEECVVEGAKGSEEKGG